MGCHLSSQCTRDHVWMCVESYGCMCGSGDGGGGGEKGQIRYNNNNNNNNTGRAAAIRLFDRLFATVVDISMRKKNLLDVDRLFSLYFSNDQNFLSVTREWQPSSVVHLYNIMIYIHTHFLCIYCIYYSCFPVQVAFIDGALGIHIIISQASDKYGFCVWLIDVSAQNSTIQYATICLCLYENKNVLNRIEETVILQAQQSQ